MTQSVFFFRILWLAERVKNGTLKGIPEGWDVDEMTCRPDCPDWFLQLAERLPTQELCVRPDALAEKLPTPVASIARRVRPDGYQRPVPLPTGEEVWAELRARHGPPVFEEDRHAFWVTVDSDGYGSGNVHLSAQPLRPDSMALSFGVPIDTTVLEQLNYNLWDRVGDMLREAPSDI